MKMQMQHKLSVAERERERERREWERKREERECERRVLSLCSPHSIWCPLSVAATSATDRMSCRVHAVSIPCPGRVLACWLIKMRSHLAKVKNYPAQGAKHATKTRRRTKKKQGQLRAKLVDYGIHCQMERGLCRHCLNEILLMQRKISHKNRKIERSSPLFDLFTNI